MHASIGRGGILGRYTKLLTALQAAQRNNTVKMSNVRMHYV